jgi:transcriptional regulator with XRE-family HTH domain
LPNQRRVAARPGSANAVDIYVGTRIRSRRLFLKLTQDVLAERIGVTFQQVQKYENGSNRISASRLYQVARFLRVPVAYFFEGLDELPARHWRSGDIQTIEAFLLDPDGYALALLVATLRNSHHRTGLLEFVRCLSS